MDRFGGGRVNHSQSKRDRVIKDKKIKRLKSPEEKGEETVTLIIFARQTPRERDKERERDLTRQKS